MTVISKYLNNWIYTFHCCSRFMIACRRPSTLFSDTGRMWMAFVVYFHQSLCPRYGWNWHCLDPGDSGHAGCPAVHLYPGNQRLPGSTDCINLLAGCPLEERKWTGLYLLPCFCLILQVKMMRCVAGFKILEMELVADVAVWPCWVVVDII